MKRQVWMGKLMMNEKLNPVSTQGDCYLTWLRKVTSIPGSRSSCFLSLCVCWLFKDNRLEHHEQWSGLLLISVGPPRYL